MDTNIKIDTEAIREETDVGYGRFVDNDMGGD